MEKKVFEGLNLKIKANDKIFIYGDTGSGKSTLMDILLGLKKQLVEKLLLIIKIIPNHFSLLVKY